MSSRRWKSAIGKRRWIDGLDRIHKLRGINFCVDLSATPYYLGRVGQDANRPFPWVVSDFGLTDAIESGLVKIPQLAVRDPSGHEIPDYFNIWKWIIPKLTAKERGGRRGSVSLGFAIPYVDNGRPHDYQPDFIVRPVGSPERYVILETKGFDPLAEVKTAAAERWAAAVNADGQFGQWSYALAKSVPEVRDIIDKSLLPQRH